MSILGTNIVGIRMVEIPTPPPILIPEIPYTFDTFMTVRVPEIAKAFMTVKVPETASTLMDVRVKIPPIPTMRIKILRKRFMFVSTIKKVEEEEV